MKKFLILIIFIVLAVGGWVFWHSVNIPSASPGGKQKNAAAFNKSLFSLDDPASIWVIVNKHRSLAPVDYAPNDLVAPDIPLRLPAKNDEMLMRAEAARALEDLYKGAKQAGLELMVASAYRSYSYQKGLYNGYVKQQGQAVADTQSARAGHSEHQTGLAVDLEPASRECEVESCFAETPEGQWLAANAYNYGFVTRYQKDKQSVTGYIYEPWHVRYVGAPLAQELHSKGNPTLEEFFGLETAPDYR